MKNGLLLPSRLLGQFAQSSFRQNRELETVNKGNFGPDRDRTGNLYCSHRARRRTNLGGLGGLGLRGRSPLGLRCESSVLTNSVASKTRDRELKTQFRLRAH